MNQIQKKIAEKAYENAHSGKTMPMNELAEELCKDGFKSTANRGLARQVATTYSQAKREQNLGVANNIAETFTDDNGEYLYDR